MTTTQAALVDAARAVCDRWDSPAWKWGDGPTADIIATLRAALAQAEAAQPVAQWVPVTQELPPSGKVVLACYVNRAGRMRRIRAEWIAARSREANSEDSEIGIYDEATDTFYDPEGWYERIDNWGDYSAVAVCEGEVTHWMPLPAAPQPPAGEAP